MATFNQRDNELLFLGGDAALSTGGIDTLNNGEIGLFTPSGTRLTEANAAGQAKFMIVQGRGSDVNIISSPIVTSAITYSKAQAFVADTQQVDYIGYNGTSGSIDVLNDNYYHIRLSLRQGKTSNHGGLYLKHGVYTSGLAATQEDIAAFLHESLVANFSREADRVIRFERLYSGATAAVAETYDFTYGSKFALGSAAPTVTAGDVIKDPATGYTYIIVNVDVASQTIELDVAWQGPTTAALAVEDGAIGGDWGICLEGQPLKFVTGKLHHSLASWDLSLEGFGATNITNSSAAKQGTGTERYVKELEFFLQGNEGDFYRMGEPNIFPRRALATGDYDMVHLASESLHKETIVANPIRKTYTVVIPESTPAYADAVTPDTFYRVLEVIIEGSVTGNLTP